MERERKIDEILDKLVRTGSEIPYIEELKKSSLSEVRKDRSVGEVLDTVAKEVIEKTSAFLDQKNPEDVNYVNNISTCIYLPDYTNKGSYKLRLLGGTKSRTSDIPINTNTLYDIASLTKLYTLILTFKLEELGILDLNARVSEINPDFKNFGDFTLNDLIRLCGIIKTVGRVNDAKTKKTADKIFRTAYLESDTREENAYTDLGAMILGDTIAKVISRLKGVKMTFKQVMEEYLFKPLNLHHTVFNPKTSNITGNNDGRRMPNDPKSRILGGALGHAGIFVTSDDLTRLADALLTVTYVNYEHIVRLGEITFPNAKYSNRGNLGMYVKSPAGYDVTYAPPEFSTGTFSHEGYTGSMAVFDPNNRIHYNILVDSLLGENNKKPSNFTEAFQEYQMAITQDIMEMYVVNEYFKMTERSECKEDIDSVYRI